MITFLTLTLKTCFVYDWNFTFFLIDSDCQTNGLQVTRIEFMKRFQFICYFYHFNKSRAPAQVPTSKICRRILRIIFVSMLSLAAWYCLLLSLAYGHGQYVSGRDYNVEQCSDNPIWTVFATTKILNYQQTFEHTYLPTYLTNFLTSDATSCRVAYQATENSPLP